MAASSKYLESLLQTMNFPEEDASIIFTDMSNDELEQLISFLYTGNVSFASCMESQRFKSLIHQLGIQVPLLSNSEEDDLSNLMVDDFGQSTVDQSQILYEFQAAQNVDQILAEIMSDLVSTGSNSKLYLYSFLPSL